MTDNNDLWNLDRQDYVAIVTDLRADLAEARAELEQEPTATLRQQLRGSQSALSKVMGELTEARESATRRSTEYAKVQAELYQKIEAEQAQTREAYRQRDAARQDEAEARADVARFEAQLDAANRELANELTERDAARAEAKRLQDLIERRRIADTDMVCYVCERPMRSDQAVTDQDIDNICPACASETIGTLNHASRTLRAGAEQADARYRADLAQARAERDEAMSKVREHAEHVNYYGDLYSRTEVARRGLDEQVEFYRGELAKAQVCADEMAALAWKWKYKADCQRETTRALVVAARALRQTAWNWRMDGMSVRDVVLDVRARVGHINKQSGQQAGE